MSDDTHFEVEEIEKYYTRKVVQWAEENKMSERPVTLDLLCNEERNIILSDLNMILMTCKRNVLELYSVPDMSIKIILGGICENNQNHNIIAYYYHQESQSLFLANKTQVFYFSLAFIKVGEKIPESIQPCSSWEIPEFVRKEYNTMIEKITYCCKTKELIVFARGLESLLYIISENGQIKYTVDVYKYCGIEDVEVLCLAEDQLLILENNDDPPCGFTLNLTNQEKKRLEFEKNYEKYDSCGIQFVLPVYNQFLILTDGDLVLFDPHTHQIVTRIETNYFQDTFHLLVLPQQNDNMKVVLYQNGELMIYSLIEQGKKELCHLYTVHLCDNTDNLLSLSFQHGTEFLYLQEEDKKVKVWDFQPHPVQIWENSNKIGDLTATMKILSRYQLYTSVASDESNDEIKSNFEANVPVIFLTLISTGLVEENSFSSFIKEGLYDPRLLITIWQFVYLPHLVKCLDR